MSEPLHPVLRRQLNKLDVQDPVQPPDSAIWGQLLDRVSLVYAQADDDRYRLERSLSLASEEMQQEISERKQAEQLALQTNRQLARAHDLFRSTLEHMLLTVQRGASREEIVAYLRDAEVEFNKLDQQRARLEP